MGKALSGSLRVLERDTVSNIIRIPLSTVPSSGVNIPPKSVPRNAIRILPCNCLRNPLRDVPRKAHPNTLNHVLSILENWISMQSIKEEEVSLLELSVEVKGGIIMGRSPKFTEDDHDRFVDIGESSKQAVCH